MYQRWADKKGIYDRSAGFPDGDEAGIKSITVQINGENAFGYLKSEKAFTGWYVFHRLMRQERGRLPFVSCDVMPDIEEDPILRSIRMICVLIPTDPAAQADSISTRRRLPSVLPISRPGIVVQCQK